MNKSEANLNSGFKIPLIGFGTWKSKDGEAEKAVFEALRVGYRHIDCAWIYHNQHEVASALKQAMDKNLVQREELFITSKLWNTFHGGKKIEDHCRENLKQLGLNYLDLFLIHWPVPEPDISETWKAMENLVDLGLVKSIGVSNFSISKVKNLLDKNPRILPAVNQCEAHPLWNQNELFENMNSLGIHFSAYSPLGSPDSSQMLLHNGSSVLNNPTVLNISHQTGKTPAQVALRWGVQRGYSVLPKSVTPTRIQSNFELASWSLTPEQMKALTSIPNQIRLIQGHFWVSPEGPWNSVDELWA